MVALRSNGPGLARRAAGFTGKKKALRRRLEQRLYELERAYKGLEDDQILETKFRIVEVGGTFRPEVVEQTPKH